MRISEFKRVLKAHLLTPLSIVRNRQFLRYFSLRQQKVLLVLALVLLGLHLFKVYFRPSSPQMESVQQEVVVEVMGEVWKPGVYLFPHSPSLKEAIERAGGLKHRTTFDQEIPANSLRTGTLLNIRKEPNQEIHITIGRMEANKLLVFQIPLDLNRVSTEDLCLIPGIGESLAREIIAYRERRKGFRSVEELKHVRGIGEKNWQTFQPFLTVVP